MTKVLIVIVVILIIIVITFRESFGVCGGECDQKQNKSPVINPFVYPYSGEQNTNIYSNILAAESPGEKKYVKSLQHSFETDHVPPNEL